MVFENYDEVGIELDNVYNKTREGHKGTCMAHAYDITKNHRREEWESTKEDSHESCERHN